MVVGMHINLSRILFAAFVLFFVLAAPVVVLYTAGYRLNISNQRLQQTGVVVISTQPRNSTISLNGHRFAQKTPFVMQRVMPALHTVVLHKQGYHEWSQGIRVDEGRTTYITARLFADSQPQLLNTTDAGLVLRARKSLEVLMPDDASVNLLNNGAHIEVHTGSGANDQLIALLPINEYRVLKDDAEYLLMVDQTNLAFVIARHGGAVVKLDTRLTAFDWLDDENLLLWTDGTEVNIYDAATNKNTFITREGQATVDVAWHPEADSFFIATTTSITAYDRFVHETRETVLLLTDDSVFEIWLDAAGKTLYYLDQPPITPDSVSIPIYALPLAV